MITVVEYENVLEPQKKRSSSIEHRVGRTVAGCIEGSCADMAFWHNGRLLNYDQARCAPVTDGDFLAYAYYPSGVETLIIVTFVVLKSTNIALSCHLFTALLFLFIEPHISVTSILRNTIQFISGLSKKECIKSGHTDFFRTLNFPSFCFSE